MSKLSTIKKQLHALAKPQKAAISQSFFKTGPGQYAHGDRFIGVTMPQLRKLIPLAHTLVKTDIIKLVQSPIHEERMLGLLCWVKQYHTADSSTKNEICKLYVKHSQYINNWDLVDVTVEHILGAHLAGDDPLLINWASSKNLWERRMAMIAQFYHIKRGNSDSALAMAKRLLKDEHDLIHKAVGWMLREIGKRCSVKTLEAFLQQHYQNMPRTMLRYAIEKFPETKRKAYLNGSI